MLYSIQPGDCFHFCWMDVVFKRRRTLKNQQSLWNQYWLLWQEHFTVYKNNASTDYDLLSSHRIRRSMTFYLLILMSRRLLNSASIKSTIWSSIPSIQSKWYSMIWQWDEVITDSIALATASHVDVVIAAVYLRWKIYNPAVQLIPMNSAWPLHQ